MSSQKIHKIEYEIYKNSRAYLKREHQCYYFMEKQSEGYTLSDTNNKIFNLKKSLDRKGKEDWKYKLQAINQFANDLKSLNFSKDSFTIIPAPTSNPRNSINFDNRLDIACNILAKAKNNLKLEIPFDVKISTTPSHLGGGRKIDVLKENLIWTGFSITPSNYVILIDDVYTTGCHFSVWRDFILENDKRVKDVIGVFWAIHMWI